MADSKAIGILFEVQGGGSIDKGTGKRINGQLRNIVGQISKTDTLKLKFQIDSNHFQKEIDKLKKQLQGVVVNNPSSSKSAGGGAGTQVDGYQKAQKAMSNYYQMLGKVQRAQTRSLEIGGDNDNGGYYLHDKASQRWRALINEYKQAKTNFEKAKSALDDEQLSELDLIEREHKMRFDVVEGNNIANAEQAWANLTAKVNSYIDQVEYSASRNPDVAEQLKDLRDMANSADYRGYDALKQKLYEVQQQINANGLATETWYQKMVKTFGSRVRSALAGIAVAKAGQYLKMVYDNVVKLDSAIVDLQIASGKNREEVKALVKEYSQLGRTLGATTEEVAKSADTWLRQGYDTSEANTLITNSMMLSKLGQIESADAAKALTSAMKGYNVTVEDSVAIVDKFTAVDMIAATSAGDIATAMAETAASARIAGVSMDKLIGYIATVSEVTQDGAESVGTFYKTLFARMNSISAGNFIDEETGESLNDVEKVLQNLGIDLRDANDVFRDSSDVLDEVGRRWSEFDNIQRHAIATAFAGTRQQEKFIVLMENYGDAAKYATEAANSAGNATEKFRDYLGGIEAKFDALKATFEELSMNILNSDLIADIVDFTTWILNVLSLIIEHVGGLNTLLYATLAVLATIKADAIFSFLLGFFPKLFGMLSMAYGKILEFVAALIAAKASGLSMGDSIVGAFNAIGVSASAAQVAVGAFMAVLGIAIMIINSVNQAKEESIRQSISSSQAYLAEAESAKENADALDELIDKYKELSKNNDGVFSGDAANAVRKIQDNIVDIIGDQGKAIDLVNGKLETQLGILQNISKTANEDVKEKANEALKDAEVALLDSIKRIRTGDKARYEIDQVTSYDLYHDLFDPDSYGDIVADYSDGSEVWLWNERWMQGAAEIKVNFDTAEDFAKQYEAVLSYKEELAKSTNAEDFKDRYFYNEIEEFLTDYKDVYNAYKDAKEFVDKLESDNANGESVDKKIVSLKSLSDIMGEVQEKYDALSRAMDDMSENGYLSQNTIESLIKVMPELESELEVTANGYKLATDALDKFIESKKNEYLAILATAEAGSQNYENAYDNLKNLLAIFATLEFEKGVKSETEALEKQKEALEDQADKFNELIDVRKELLDTYKEEIDYQKELARKQQNVAKLQTSLAVARMDNSAAGRSRVRELESELQDAQDELNDFTLERAIDVLTQQLDREQDEYNKLISDEVERITEAINGVKTTISNNVSNIGNVINQLLLEYKAKNPNVTNNSGGESEQPANKYKNYIGVWTAAQADLLLDDGMSWGTAKSLGVVYKNQQGEWNISEEEWNRRRNKNMPEYHSGGLVGGVARLKSDEEFAKLLDGEFVSTPSQMRRFMQRTLPNMMSVANSHNGVICNAPLVAITCGSVTEETLPKLQQLVNEASKKIKSDIDSVFARTGFKHRTNKFSIKQ